MTKHIMIDIETLSTKNEAVVLSIGAVEFNPLTGQVADEFYHELRQQDQDHRDISISTLSWWMNQLNDDPKKVNVFLNDKPTPVRMALLKLQEFIGEIETRVWACDPDFDCAILEDLFQEYKLPTPWKFYEKRSVRTIRELAALHNVALPKTKKTHNALEDCYRQIDEVVAFNKGVKQ